MHKLFFTFTGFFSQSHKQGGNMLEKAYNELDVSGRAGRLVGTTEWDLSVTEYLHMLLSTSIPEKLMKFPQRLP